MRKVLGMKAGSLKVSEDRELCFALFSEREKMQKAKTVLNMFAVIYQTWIEY